MKRSGWVLIGAACSACCAPLLAPLVLGVPGLAGAAAGIAAWLGGLGLAEAVCAALVVGAVGFALLWSLRARAAEKARRSGDPSCVVGGSCDPRVERQTE